MNKILIVDDEEDITIAISEYLKRHDLGISPLVTNDPRLVFPILAENEDVRLILSDFRMPAVNGLDLLLRVKSQYPRILFMIMTGYGTAELEKEGLRRGAIRYIEKPFDIPKLVKIIQEALHSASAGFGGIIEEVQLPDIIQLIGMSGRTVALGIVADQGRGTVFFQDGEVVHAVCGNLAGEEAFYEIFGWSGGQFALAARSPGNERTIFGTWQGLLLEAARRLDEATEESRIEKAESTDNNDTIDSFSLDELEPEITEAPVDEGREEADQAEKSETQEISAEEAMNPVPADDKESTVIPPEEPTEDYRIFPDDVSDEEVKDSHPPKEIESTVLGVEQIGGSLKEAVNKYAETWPQGQKHISFQKIPFEHLSEEIKRHLEFQFHLLAISLIRTDNVPFSLENDPVKEALENLHQALRKSWTIDKAMYLKMLHEAVRFTLAISIDPARAIAQFLRENAEGHVSKMKRLIDDLIDFKLINPDYKQLTEEFDRHGDPRLHPKKVENFVRTILDRRKEEDGFLSMRTAMQNILRIASHGSGKEIQLIQFEIIIDLLESRGLQEVTDYIKIDEKTGNNPFSLKSLDMLMNRYRQYIQDRNG